MKKVLKYISIVVVLFFFSCSEEKVDIVGLGTINGRVVEADSFDPIENAKIALSPTNNTVFSDENGYFTMENVESGEYSVSSTKEGYLTGFEAATVSTGLEVNVIFEMEDETALNRPPTTPVLVTPEDGTIDTELSVEFIWESEDPEEDPIIYTLELKNDYNDDVIKIEEIVDTTYVVSNLKYGVKYFWQVGASDDINPIVLSAVSSFKTKINPDNRYFYVQNASNGNHVIYSSNFDEDNMDLEDEDDLNNKVQLTEDSQNSWRPRKNQASNLIAFLRTFNNKTHLFTMNQDGSDVKQVTSTVPLEGYNMNEIEYSWSSNGNRFIYPHYNKLYLINKDGSGLEQIYETTDGSFITECDWSHDESMIALKTNNSSGYNVSIFTIDILGNTIKTVLSGVPGAAGGLNISVNNKLLLYTYDITGYEDSSNRQLDTHMFTFNLETDEVLDISNDKQAGTIDVDPRFSPNEAEVIFVNTSNDGVSVKSINKVSINGSDRIEMFNNAIMPDWE